MTRHYLLESLLLITGLLCAPVAAQTSVTPTLMPTPAGQLITVNNAPNSDHYDPHVSDDLVAYSNVDPSGAQTIHYFNLVTGADAVVLASPGTSDFLSDVKGSVIAFTRVDSTKSAIFMFDTSNPTAAPLSMVAVPTATTRESILLRSKASFSSRSQQIREVPSGPIGHEPRERT